MPDTPANSPEDKSEFSAINKNGLDFEAIEICSPSDLEEGRSEGVVGGHGKGRGSGESGRGVDGVGSVGAGGSVGGAAHLSSIESPASSSLSSLQRGASSLPPGKQSVAKRG